MNDDERSREQLLDELRTLRERADAERIATDALLHDVLARSSAIKLLIDPKTAAIVDANASAAAFYGYSLEELRRLKINDLNPLPAENVQREMAAAAAEQRTYFRFSHRIASGEKRSVEVYSGPIHVRGRELLLSIVHDVSDREHAKEELIRSETRWRSLMEALPVAVCLHREARFVYANPAASTMLGYKGDELIGLPTLDIVHEDDRAAIVALRAQIVERGETNPISHIRYRRKDGHVVDAETFGLPVEIDGRPAIMTVTNDVTEKLNLEEQLRRSQRMEAVGRLAGGVAHDFNNLLFVILSSAQFLLRRIGSDELAAADLEQITAASQRAADLTRQLLLFSRGAEMKTETLELNGVVSDIARLLRGTLGEEVELRTQLCNVPCGVKVARPNIEQVLVNLAVNARDAMPHGGQLTVETNVVDLDASAARLLMGLEPGRYVKLVVRDTGVGMSQEVAARAFDPFFTTKEAGRGTGLGLAITYGIVQKAGGHIALSSSEGTGTRFTVHLPLVEPIPDTSSRRPPAATRAPTKTGETILLVEDESAVRSVVERSLSDAGYRVLAAPGPGEALLAAEQHAGTIHLLLTDMVMPRMYGSELAERLSKLRPEMRVLFMTGYAGDALSRRGVHEAEISLLHKPFTESELLTRVRQLLGGPL